MDATRTAAAIVTALWSYGSPSRLWIDPDSERIVAWSTQAALVESAREIGDDAIASGRASAAQRQLAERLAREGA